MRSPVVFSFWLAVAVAAPAQSLDVIHVTNSTANTVSKIQRAGGVVATLTLPGVRPVGLAVRANGDVWVALQTSGNVHALDAAGSAIGTYPTTGSRPTGMAVDRDGNVWCASQTGSVDKFAPTGATLGTYSTGGTASYGVACDSGGNAWVADGAAGRAWKMSSSGAVLLTVAHAAHRAVAVDSRDNVFTTGFGSPDLRKYAPDGTVLGTYTTMATQHQSLAVDREDNVWMAYQAGSVFKYSNGGTPLGTFATGGVVSVGVAVDGIGHVWVTNVTTHTVGQLTPDGALVRTLPVGLNPISFGDATGFQRAVFTDPFGDVDGDGHLNAAEAVAARNPFDPQSVPCSLTVSGDRRPGGIAVLNYQDLGANAPGSVYAMANAFGSTGGPTFGKRRIDLTPDNLFFFSLNAPSLFQSYLGVLDGSGRGTGTLVIPAIAQLTGFTVYSSAITVDPTAPHGVRTIAPSASFVIQK